MPARPTTIALAACLLLGCPAPESPSSDAGAGGAPPDAGPCDEPASLYGIDADEEEAPLSDGSTLPITLGFQGFQYVRVGLSTPRALPARVDLAVRVAIEDGLERTTPFFGVETRAAEGGESESADVSVMFNDVPLAELVGRGARVEIRTVSPGCALAAGADVILVQGAFMGADGGLSDPDAGDGG